MLRRPVDDDVARGQRGVDIAVLQPCRVEHVVGKLLLVADAAGRDRRVRVAEVRAGIVGGDLDASARRSRPGGGLEVEHRLERIEVDLHELGAVLGGRLALGHHERDRMPCVDDLLARQRLVGAPATGRHQRQVGGGQDRNHPGDLQRGLGRNRGDHRVGLVGEDQARVQEPRDSDVGGEPRRAAHLGSRVSTRGGDAHGSHRNAT